MKKRIGAPLAAIGATLALTVFSHSGFGVSAAIAQSSGAQPALPDLIVDQAMLRQHWVVRVEDLPADFCSVQEGGITPGTHTLVRFTVSTPNIGDADLDVGDPNQHLNDGLFELASCHKHYHFRHYALYELVNTETGFVWRAAKRGFCMEDIERFKGYTGDVDNKPRFRGCGAIGIRGNQGISAGWTDIYNWKLGGQYFVLDGGDNQPAVPPGQYVIRVTVNPGFVPAKGEPCRYEDPNRRHVCHQLPESDYENNVGQVTITIPSHPGRQGVGPLKNQPALAVEPVDGQ